MVLASASNCSHPGWPQQRHVESETQAVGELTGSVMLCESHCWSESSMEGGMSVVEREPGTNAGRVLARLAGKRVRDRLFFRDIIHQKLF